MIRRFVPYVVCAACMAVAISGCQKSADQQSSQDANSSSSPPKSESATSAIKRALEPRPLVVPADSVLTVVLDQTLSSKTSKSGDKFSATVESPIEVEGKVAIPKGARTEGVVKDAKSAGRFKGGAALSLQLTSITVRGKDYEIQTSDAAMSSKGKGKRTATMVGGGAAGGAAIGAIAGGGKGAAIGALIGAAAGTGGAGLTGNRDITLSAETPLDFKLVQPISVKER
jgi:outer membrane lipoprotein SlyB